MKFLKLTIAVAVMLTAFTFSGVAAPGVGSINFGITNKLFNVSTTYTNRFFNANWTVASLGSLGGAPLQYNSHGTLVFSGTCIATQTTVHAILKFMPGDEDGNFATGTSTTNGMFIWYAPIEAVGADGGTPITNTFLVTTNVPSSYVGALGTLHLYSIAYTNAAGPLTNPAVKLKIKNLISPNQ